jgi:dihydroneopterin aldolase
MLALTTNEIDDLVHGRVTVYILAKLENLSCRQLGRYMENEDFKQWLKFDVGVKTGDRKGDALELIQSWVDEASRQVINLVSQSRSLLLARIANCV